MLCIHLIGLVNGPRLNQPQNGALINTPLSECVCRTKTQCCRGKCPNSGQRTYAPCELTLLRNITAKCEQQYVEINGFTPNTNTHTDSPLTRNCLRRQRPLVCGAQDDNTQRATQWTRTKACGVTTRLNVG